MILIKWLHRMGIYEYVAKALVIVVTMALNYVGYKLFVFAGKKQAIGASDNRKTPCILRQAG